MMALSSPNFCGKRHPDRRERKRIMSGYKVERLRMDGSKKALFCSNSQLRNPAEVYLTSHALQEMPFFSNKYSTFMKEEASP